MRQSRGVVVETRSTLLENTVAGICSVRRVDVVLVLYCTVLYLFSSTALLIVRSFSVFQAFEQQSSASYSRHAVRQHAQSPSAVSTSFSLTCVVCTVLLAL